MTTQPEFILLAGFLGSGKTSLLVDWLSLPEAADMAVIVNEAGEIDVDGATIAQGGTVPMAMLANGCVCCSLTSELVITVRALVDERTRARLPAFQRIVLECSGLSRPGPILRSLMPLATLGMGVRVVTLCDAAQAPRRAEHFEEIAAQIAAAGTVVLTKLDLSGSAAAEALVAAINPLAHRVVELDRPARARAAFAPMPLATPLPEPGIGEGGHPRVSVLRVTFTRAATWEDRLDWLEDLAAFCGERLLRVKGFLRQPGSSVPLLVQAVGTLFGPLVPMTGSRDVVEGLVVIARDLDATELRAGMPNAPVRVSAHRRAAPLVCTAA